VFAKSSHSLRDSERGYAPFNASDENVFEGLTNRAAAIFLEAFELLRGNEERVRELASIALRKAQQDYRL